MFFLWFIDANLVMKVTFYPEPRTTSFGFEIKFRGP